MKTFTKLLALFSAIALIGTAAAAGSTLTVSGKVTDENGRPMTGVTVIIVGSKEAVITAPDGTYSISVSKGDKLRFSYLGYQDQTHSVKDYEILDVVMKPALQAEEIVVTAFSLHEPIFTGRVDSPRAAMDMDHAAPQRQQSYHNAYYPGGEEYSAVKENRFISVSRSPLSTFALEVDGASYSNVRRMLNSGQMPDPDAVRCEEFVNYFTYDYPEPTGGDPVAITSEMGTCPWNPKHKLASIGVRAKKIPSAELPASNFVFLIDVSGSMYGRLDMVKSSMKLLVNNLRPRDRVSIVTYANGVELKLPATPGDEKQKIREALDALTAGGGTSGARGIQLAYETARKNFIIGGNNRVIICTDGDFNVGASSPAELEKLIEAERKGGVFLSVLGYGMGNYKDNRMQVLAEKGNGNYSYIDSMQEANKVLVNEFGSTMYAVAKDVKLQVEFNPAAVQSYRLVGYESRLLRDEDFNDDTVDAGELGAGHTVTALYEIVPVGVENAPGSVDPLKYQPAERTQPVLLSARGTAEIMTVKLRYKEPDGDTSKKIEVTVNDTYAGTNTDNFKFAAAAAMFGQLLGDSDFKGTADYETVAKLAHAGAGNDPYGYRHEMARLAQTAGGLSK